MSKVREFLETKELPKDSLSMMDFIMDVEDEFDILITDAEMAETKTIGDLIALVEEKVL